MRNMFVAILTLGTLALAGDKVVVYVSLDEEYSKPVLADFQKETGIEVEAVYDTESTKTVGLVRQLIEQKAAPRADVYWNNELANTIKLREYGVLQPYVSPSAADLPAAYKDPEGYWAGFAARARVLIVNTDLVKRDAWPKSMWDLADARWKGKVCMARPATGTTATHAVALYVALGEAEADRYFDALTANDVQWVTGNAHAMREVSAGRFAFGWTDSDDFNVARMKGSPVEMVYPDKDGVGVLFIPNSLCLIAGARHPEAGKKLIDWLLRPEIEARLAKSDTAQIPVRPGVPVPEHVRRPDQVGRAMAVDFNRVGKEFDARVERVRQRLERASRPATTLVWILGGAAVVALALVFFLKRATAEKA